MLVVVSMQNSLFLIGRGSHIHVGFECMLGGEGEEGGRRGNYVCNWQGGRGRGGQLKGSSIPTTLAPAFEFVHQIDAMKSDPSIR